MFIETHERFSDELREKISALRTRILTEKIDNINLDWV